MNNNTSSHNALYGTKTAENLMHLFEHEASAAMRSGIYSKQAQQEGDISTRRMLDEMHENDLNRGELWLGYLDELDETSENLHKLSETKDVMDSDIYSEMALIADEEGFSEIAEKFRMAGSAQKNQADMLRERMSQLNGMYSWDAGSVHRCPVCGYTVIGNARPEYCPLCVNDWI